MKIPVHRPYLGEEELQAVREVFESRWLGCGAFVKLFEDRLRQILNVKHAIAVNTGTAALHLAMAVLDLQPGDEIITPSLTFPSTVQAILAVGAVPVFCEVRCDTLTMDIEDALRRMTSRTRAILPVHYGGRLCDMETLLRAVRPRGIRVIEDAAHAFGSTHNGRLAGTFGDAGCFSFDPIKNITCGGGGMVVTNEDAAAVRLESFSNVGSDTDSWSRLDSDRPWLYSVASSGFRYRMSNLNAAIGLKQLNRMPAFHKRKKAIVKSYERAFQNLAGVTSIAQDLHEVFPFNYVVRVPGGRRDALATFLRQREIGTSVQFIPMHLQPLCSAFRTSLPVTERLFQEILTLPLYFEMSDDDVATVIEAVDSFFRSGRT